MPLGNTLSIAFDPGQAISLELLDQLALCRFWIGDQELLKHRIRDFEPGEWTAEGSTNQEQVEFVVWQPDTETFVKLI